VSGCCAGRGATTPAGTISSCRRGPGAALQAALVESNPRIGGHHRKTVVSAGTSFHFGADHLHTGASDDAISVHAYSPPLWRLGQYDLSADGILSAQLDPLPR